MTYKVSVHPSVYKNFKKLYILDRKGYNYVKQRLRLLAYKPEIGVPLNAEFQGNSRIHIGPFVLVYAFDSGTNVLTLLVFEHYTRAYDMLTAYV
jgi:mRNA-degrading endonuclease RelE of RelBE toxin-antitoxin system